MKAKFIADFTSEVEDLVYEKIRQQGGVSAFYDNQVLHLVKIIRDSNSSIEKKGLAKRELESFVKVLRQNRYVNPKPRLSRSASTVVEEMALDMPYYLASQGVTSVLSWAGHDIFKTVYDGMIYPMLLSEIRPKTVIELGSGSGGSAIWLADIAQINKIDAKIISIDKRKVNVADERVIFRCSDIFQIDSLFTPEEISSLEHPWLIIEDAHVNVNGVLDFFDSISVSGDYIIVEDSLSKRHELLKFLDHANGEYMLDTKYLDMFGENTTCAMDSILVRQ
ncbi:CmcI family methyltransferase [Streptomyces cinereoruber]|uniref:CmcI family methyltransferase n=1 Tax=Streptomyces cinereoruber TaxID=67260 RepID=UPI0036325480